MAAKEAAVRVEAERQGVAMAAAAKEAVASVAAERE